MTTTEIKPPTNDKVRHPSEVESRPAESPQKDSPPPPKPTTRPLRRVATGLWRRRVETEVDDQGLYAVKCFLRDCRATALSRLERGEMSETAGFYIRETMVLMAGVVHDLVVAGDLCLARSLSAVVTHYERALGVYGNRICGQFGEMPKIDAILQKHKAKDLLAMASSHEPDWDAVVGITNRAEIEKYDEKKLRELLVSNEEWKVGRSKKKTEFRPHRLATLIEHILAGRDLEAPNINLFAEYLRRGWLWAGPTEPFKKCPWHGRKDLPNVDDWRQWRKIIMPFLKKETNEDPRQLTVFATMLSARKFVYAGGKDSSERLGDDKPAYAWNQVENRLGKAWKSMASWERKRNSKKSA